MVIKNFESSSPEFILEEYFQGKTEASGIFEDRFGVVRKQFVVSIVGAWDGRFLILDESFVYSDSTREKRLWHIEKVGLDQYEGKADDVIGVATGFSSGNALN